MFKAWTGKMCAALLLVGAMGVDAASLLQARVQGSGPAVLMLPGLGCPGQVWDGLAGVLAKTHRVHVLEVPGFAGNAPLQREGALLPSLVREVNAYVDAQQLQRPILIGHSFGGFLATHLATQQPGRFGAVIALDGVPFYSALLNPEATPAGVEPMAAQFRAALLAQDQAGFRAQQELFLRGMMRDPARAAALSQHTARSDRSTFADAMYELMTTDLRQQLQQLEQPMLLIGAVGGFDDAKARERAGAAYRAQVAGQPNIELRLAEHARHFVQFDEPQWLAQTVLGFLQRAEQRGRP